MSQKISFYRQVVISGHILIGVLLLTLSGQSLARKVGDVEYTFILPYLESETLKFDGGSEAAIESDIGFGFGVSVFHSKQLAGRMDFTWNSSSYTGTRILDDANLTTERFGGRFDSFNMLFGGDYYLTPNDLAPFISGNFGYSYIDSNIPSGVPQTACWWDPWFGYVCDYVQPTFARDTWFYGVGAGLRLDLTDRNFIKLGYYEQYLDLDRLDGSPALGIFKLEIGGKLY